MIVDEIHQLYRYASLGSLFPAAFDFLSRDDLKSIPDGKIVLQDDRLVALVASYDTLPLDDLILMEGHQRYIDIQFVVSGQEMLAWIPADRILNKGQYNSETDAWNAMAPHEQLSFARLSAGGFAILFPWDAHAPQLQAGASGRVKKIVMKVATETL